MSLNPAADANETMAKLLALENRTGYTMQQFNGQRKFWNPKWDKPVPPRGCEVFVGKIPRNLFEDELVPVFEKIGQIYELRLMMDFSGYNRGYAFVCYTCREHAQLAITRLDNYEIRPGMRIGVCRSVDNCRLFVGGIPKDKTQLEIRQAMCEISEDVSDVIVYPGSEPGEHNRGFAFVEYRTHRAAAMARRKLIPGRITLFGNEIVTDWAEPEIDANESLNRIKNVYVRNLKISTTEQTVFLAFNVLRPGAIEKVKKIEDRDYAFVHFLTREDALYAVQVMNGQKIDGQEVQVSLAKPPSNKHDTNTSSINQSSSFSNQTTTFGRINGVMMSRPIPATQTQHILNQFPAPTPSDITHLIRAQTAAKLQQSVQSLPSPPLTSFMMQPPKAPLSVRYPLLSGPKGDGSLGPISKPNDCLCNGKVMGGATGIRDFKDLVPVSTLDHIAKIQCPVVYLDEISTMFNNGIRPVYALYSDNSQGATRYVYRITFMGECYTPPSDRYCNSVPEAQKSAAEYVLTQIDPWLKKKILEVVQNSYNIKTLSTPSNVSSPATTPSLPSFNGSSFWGPYTSQACNFEPSLFTTSSTNLIPSMTSSTSSALTNSIWNQMKLSENYLTSGSFQKSGSTYQSESLKRSTPTFDHTLSSLHSLAIDG